MHKINELSANRYRYDLDYYECHEDPDPFYGECEDEEEVGEDETATQEEETDYDTNR